VVASDGVKHVFVSYVREDNEQVDKLCEALDAAQIPYWRDRTALAPGDEWKRKIREAIRSGSLVFLACFSDQSRAKKKSYMNEELTLAVEEFRLLPPGATWLIPVRFDEGDVPEWPLGAGRTLSDLNYADLFGAKYVPSLVSLMNTVGKVMGTPSADPATVRASIEEADAAERPAMLRRMTKDMVVDPARRIELDDLISQETRRVLEAIRDEEKFPTQRLAGGTNDEMVVRCAEVAASYVQMISPLCASMQVAARWGGGQTLMPWVSALRAVSGEATKMKGGNVALLELRHVPALITTFTAALASIGQGRWDNLKTLLVDVTVPMKHGDGVDVLLQVENPWVPFSDWGDLLPNVIARAAMNGESPQVVIEKFNAKQTTRLRTPVADWLHVILREHFDEQYADASAYSEAFDRAEVVLGMISQDISNVEIGGDPERSWAKRSLWFGRSTWRANYGSGAAGIIAAEIQRDGLSWPPLAAGLFGGQFDRAVTASSDYAEQFAKIANSHR
jgi:hypothetical protein